MPYTTLPHVANDYATFEKIVRDAFAMRRKTLRNSLRNHVSDEMWEQLSVRSDLRAENISVAQFVEIANLVEKSNGNLCDR